MNVVEEFKEMLIEAESNLTSDIYRPLLAWICPSWWVAYKTEYEKMFLDIAGLDLNFHKFVH